MESGDEDDAFTMGEKEWGKMNRNMTKQGYREGKNDGREKGMEESFRTGASLSVKHARKLGQLVGVLEMEIINQQKNQDSKAKLQRLNDLVEKIESRVADIKNNATFGPSFEKECEDNFNELTKECTKVCQRYAGLISKLCVEEESS